LACHSERGEESVFSFGQPQPARPEYCLAQMQRRFAVYALHDLGWSDFFSTQLAEAERNSEIAAARVAEENREMFRLLSQQGEFMAEVSGKFRHEVTARAEFPAVGDWVLASTRKEESRATIHRVLSRKSKFSRKIAGKKSEEQIVAANVDVVFIVSSLNSEFNLRRLERYVALAWESGAQPVIVLNKSDLSENPEELRREAQAAAIGVRVIVTSALRGDGIGEIRELMRSDAESDSAGEIAAEKLRVAKTAALLGSSGVGKSSLINAILGTQLLDTGEIRESDDRGRHTTTTRQLIVAPNGGVLIDTPGMRELQLWDASEGIDQAFGEIAELAANCKFRDCKHANEPGCAVRAAVELGALDSERLESFHKLGREEKFVAAKQDAAVRAAQTKELKKVMKKQNQFYRKRGR
jgi:ribosome biogenesis GTPase / thiamine phosphate phosphatase